MDSRLLREEGLISLADAARRIEREYGHAVDRSTLLRWCNRGSRVRQQLEHVRLGRRVMTSWPAVVRCIDGARVGGDSGGAAVKANNTTHSHVSAMRQLQAIGLI